MLSLGNKKKKPEVVDISKQVIHPHRAYRKLVDVGRRGSFIELLILSVPLMAVMYFLFPYLTYLNCYNAIHLLTPSIPEEFIHLIRDDYLANTVYFMSIPGSYPTMTFSFITALISFLILVIIPNIKIVPKAVGLWVGYLAFVNFVSATFFFFVPNQFPYSIRIFSELYMKTEVSMWFIIPLLLAAALLPIPSRLGAKFGVIISIVLLDVVLGIVRYFVFLYVLHHYSFLFMALMFFAFGPLVDFLYAVVTYSLFMRNISAEIRKDIRQWKWSY